MRDGNAGVAIPSLITKVERAIGGDANRWIPRLIGGAGEALEYDGGGRHQPHRPGRAIVVRNHDRLLSVRVESRVSSTAALVRDIHGTVLW